MKCYITILLILTSLYSNASPLIIAVIDTGYSNTVEKLPLCKTSYIDFTGGWQYGDADLNKHGSNIASLIYQNAKISGYCIQSLKVFSRSGRDIVFSFPAYLKALKYVINTHPFLINLSLAGRTQNDEETELIKSVLDHGTKVVAAAGNDSLNLDDLGCIIYPACSDSRITVVGNSTSHSSNTGYRYITIAVDGSNKTGAGVTLTGTSQATAVVSGQLVYKELKGIK